MLCAELVMNTSREASRKCANNVFKFLYSTRLSASDYREQLTTKKNSRNSITKISSNQIFASYLAPVAVLQRDNRLKDEKHTLFMKIPIDGMDYQL